MSLPSGYKQLEYIQSSGTQYIDTGFKPKQSTRVVMDLQLLSTSGVPYVFGTWAGGMNNCFSVYWWTDVHNSWGVDYGTQRSAIPQTSWNKRLTVDLNQNVVTVDGVSYTLTTTTFTATNNLFLLALNNGNSALDYTVGKVYGCKIYDNGTLVRDFIPCKNASGVIGLWDDVSSTFYQNAGSGAFTAGPEVKGTNKTLIDGTVYSVTSGKCLVCGTAYDIKKGRTLIEGTGCNIPLAPKIPIGTQYLIESTQEWEVPADGMYRVEIHGGGGAGGIAGYNSGYYPTSGGSGGGSGEVTTIVLIAGEKIAVTIGMGGKTHQTSQSGDTGGASSFGDYLSVNGGGGGGASYSSVYAGVGGSASGSIATQGQNGQTYGYSVPIGGYGNKDNPTQQYGNGGNGGYYNSSNDSIIPPRNGNAGAVIITYIGT